MRPSALSAGHALRIGSRAKARANRNRQHNRQKRRQKRLQQRKTHGGPIRRAQACQPLRRARRLPPARRNSTPATTAPRHLPWQGSWCGALVTGSCLATTSPMLGHGAFSALASSYRYGRFGEGQVAHHLWPVPRAAKGRRVGPVGIGDHLLELCRQDIGHEIGGQDPAAPRQKGFPPPRRSGNAPPPSSKMAAALLSFLFRPRCDSTGDVA